MQLTTIAALGRIFLHKLVISTVCTGPVHIKGVALELFLEHSYNCMQSATTLGSGQAWLQLLPYGTHAKAEKVAGLVQI